MSKVYVMGLESSGTKWLGQLIAMTIGYDSVHHISLPRYFNNEGRYIHDSGKFGLRERAKIAIVVRDVNCAMASNIKYNENEQDCRLTALKVSGTLQQYLADARFNTKVFSYECAMYLQDAYTLPWISDFCGVPFPTWAYSIKYDDGNGKYIRGLPKGDE